MSKIDDYKSIKNRNQLDISHLNEVLRLKSDGSATNPYNDKGLMRFCDKKIWNTDVALYVHASYGYYGSSSVHSACSPNLSGYILRALNGMTQKIIEKTQELLAADIELARRAAEEEAMEVLKETEIPNKLSQL